MDVRNVHTAVARALKSQLNTWAPEFVYTTVRVARGLLDGKLSEHILDAYPTDDEFPEQLSTAIIRMLGLKAADDGDGVTTEEIGAGITALRALRTGDVALEDHAGHETWQLHQDNIEAHELTIEQLRTFVTGMTWAQVAQLVVDAENTPLDEANPCVIAGTGRFVARWLRPGDPTWAGGPVEDGQRGMQISGGVTELLGTPAELAAFGERLAMRWQSPITVALSALGAALDDDPCKWATSLTCDTADALVTVLALSGNFDTALRLLMEHATGDDEPGIDRHDYLRDLGLRDEQQTPAGQTVEYELCTGAARGYLLDLIVD